ncbi:GntR family transcriptional regulator [Lachnoclostridium pacaense]|uniref:GntR family transcriptional regulator n=1 Tax=Enterocloster hominis (ex Hitch et al. 2024) TaxID=1917870 RepID=UPI001D0FD7BA|nr:GntR family transcriptional regulator [Lachnoclostridium pacaense]MCC2877727.1 GntR family transcriptional regulator [Lachnoclostridium pacaense]
MERISERDKKVNLEEFVNISLVDMVADKIRSNIYNGKYLPGKRLVVRELSEELGVSHTPIKDALNRLVSEGYVVALPRRSMVVREYSTIEFIDNFETRLMFELYHSAEILEHAKKDGRLLADLEEYKNTMEDLVKNNEDISYETWVNCETGFHQRYMKECSNQKVYELYCQLDTNRQSYFTYMNNNRLPLSLDIIHTNCQEHSAIVEAIRSGEAKTFCQVVSNHLIRACGDYTVDEPSKKRFQQMIENAERFLKNLT